MEPENGRKNSKKRKREVVQHNSHVICYKFTLQILMVKEYLKMIILSLVE